MLDNTRHKVYTEPLCSYPGNYLQSLYVPHCKGMGVYAKMSTCWQAPTRNVSKLFDYKYFKYKVLP
jgi:hypothetical protein